MNWNDRVRTELGSFRSVISNHLVTDADITEPMKAQGFVGQFRNLGARDLETNGIDGKLMLKLGERRPIDAFINFTQYFGADDGTGSEIGYIPKTMINANLNVPVSWLNVNLGANYRGNFTQPEYDARESVPGYLLLNLTVLAEAKGTPMELRFGIRNLLDSDVRYPSSSTSFTEHFRGRGMEVWCGASYKF